MEIWEKDRAASLEMYHPVVEEEDSKGFLCRHPREEALLKIEEDKVIVDMKDWAIAREMMKELQQKTEELESLEAKVVEMPLEGMKK